MGESNQLIVLNSERLATWELCPRRYHWQEKYLNLRVSLVRALYMALDAGLRAETDPEKAAENQFLSLARSPGLDIAGEDVYAIAVHHAKLAGILALALRSAWDVPWKAVDPVDLPRGRTWHSALYDAGEDYYRRIALVDSWSDSRRLQEVYGWRTLGEVCAMERTILLHAITIGTSHERRRHSPWTRCYLAPRGNAFRFKRIRAKEGFSGAWRQDWRENMEIPTEDWLTKMREDGCITDLVHTVKVPIPTNKNAYESKMLRMSQQMRQPVGDFPDFRLAGCFGFSPCAFRAVCHGGTTPEAAGFVRRGPAQPVV